MTDATQQIIYHILAYLAEKPDAKDTLTGISGWWLSELSWRPTDAAVKNALDKLIDKKLILAEEKKDTETLYKFNSQKLKEISVGREGLEKLAAEVLLAEGSDPPSD